MQPYRIWHRVFVGISIIAILLATYVAILVNDFKTPEATSIFLKNSNAYYYIAEIIKVHIQNRYPAQLKYNVIKLAAADALLNQIVSPDLVERIALPALTLRAKAAQLPLSFVGSDLVLDTAQYTQQFSNTLSSLQLPSALEDAGKSLIASVPPRITIIDVEKNPNSILASITKTRMFFENLQKVLNFTWIVLILAIVGLFLVNNRIIRRLIGGFCWIFAVCGVFVFLFSFIFPAIGSSISSNPDPIAGVLKENMVNDMVTYYFSQTRSISIVYLLIAVVLYAAYHFVSYAKVQEWIDTHIVRAKTAQVSQSARGKRSSKK